MEQKTFAYENKGGLAFFKGLQGIGLIFILAVYFYYLAGQMDEFPGQLGPAFWPRATLILLMAGCVIKVIEILLARREAGQASASSPLPAIHALRLAGLIGMVVGAVALMDQIGFMLTNLIFLLSFMHLAGVRKKSTLVLTPVFGTVILLYLFVKVVYLPLPKGAWFFEDLTIAAYRLLWII